MSSLWGKHYSDLLTGKLRTVEKEEPKPNPRQLHQSSHYTHILNGLCFLPVSKYKIMLLISGGDAENSTSGSFILDCLKRDPSLELWLPLNSPWIEKSSPALASCDFIHTYRQPGTTDFEQTNPHIKCYSLECLPQEDSSYSRKVSATEEKSEGQIEHCDE